LSIAKLCSYSILFRIVQQYGKERQPMTANPLKQELENRIDSLRKALIDVDPGFDTALVTGRVNQYYFTGTMQDGLLVVKRDGGAYYFVRRSLERALDECPLDIVYPMMSYRDMVGIVPTNFGNTYIETESVPIAMLGRLQKYFKMDKINPLDRIIFAQRAIKSPRELELIRQSGRQHLQLLEEIAPSLLREGISEAEFQGELFAAMIKLGYQGVSRFSIFQTEMVVGQLGFGENSVYPTSFDGPGGMKGMNAASPAIGSRKRRLKKGDLVFVDIGYGVGGYHSDKTQVYSFGAPPEAEIVKIHRACIEVERRCAAMLVAGAIPSQIYAKIMDNLPEGLSEGFMGYPKGVCFLGHGVGLHIDEPPAIAKGFDTPLAENMVIALEPKCGIPGVGTVGVEDTYIITAGGSECVTGGGRDIMTV